MKNDVRPDILLISRKLSRELADLSFSPPVLHVYDPLQYAYDAWEQFVLRYASSPKKAVFLGMNPGPFGMVQTGIPFGDVAMVKDWLSIKAKIGKPGNEHPKRPVTGFSCTRSEISGTRFWGWLKQSWGTPENFFRDHFVANYCPLAFLEASGKNRTPDKLPENERHQLLEICDRHMHQMLLLLSPVFVIGIGKFAANRAKIITKGTDMKVLQILHPSPASPLANKNWGEKAESQLREKGFNWPYPTMPEFT